MMLMYYIDFIANFIILTIIIISIPLGIIRVSIL